jgi:hypothetical protein
MRRKNPEFPGAKLKFGARFRKKRVKSRAFSLTHFNIPTANRPSRVRIHASGGKKGHFRGVRGKAFS